MPFGKSPRPDPDRHARRGKSGDPRHLWRERSHHASHSGGGVESLPPIAAHPRASREAPLIVTATGQLTEMIEHLRAAGAFAFDSEFIGELSYEPRLCLVQAATAQKVFVADPLAGLDLMGLWELLTAPATEKIVHAGQQDFGPAVQRTGRPPANVLDVQIAAGFVHADYPLSLSRLLETFVGVSLGKAVTFTHWDRRPLSGLQVRYAGDDVRYLPAAREAIERLLSEKGRSAWAREECAAALEDPSLYRPAPQALYLRVRGRDRLRRRQLAVLRELAIVRDLAAREQDVPPRSLLKDGVLLALARRPVRRLADLDDIKGLPRPVESAYGRHIVEATSRAMALPDGQLPPAEPAETSALRERSDEVLARVTQFCRERSVAPSLVAGRKEIARACRAKDEGQSLEEHRLFRGWRSELLGDLVKGLL